ncbi:hypothetical protein [Sphingomonas adhaesiva]|uniref:hypothetical protein n=1 Tax=Sphingomonas adhaesiva TaxID=28212 RepID=UPI002FF90E77
MSAASAGTINIAVSAAGATSVVVAVTLTAAQIPLAPTLVAAGGDRQAILTITDNPASTGVQKYNLYESATSGGTFALVGCGYRSDQTLRRFLANGSTAFYKLSAVNAAGESPLSAAASATAAAGNINPPRLARTLFFKDTLFYALFVSDYPAGAQIVTTSDDGAALTTQKADGTAPTSSTGWYEVTGTFTSPGRKTLTHAVTIGGVTTNFTQVVDVVARPALRTAADMLATAQAMKAAYNARSTFITDPAITLTQSASFPSGYDRSKSYFVPTNSPPVGANYAVSKVNTSQFGSGFDPIEKKIVPNGVAAAQATGRNTRILFSTTKRTFVVPTSGQTVFTVRFTDDNFATVREAPDPNFVIGSTYTTVDTGSVPPGRRIVVVEYGDFAGVPVSFMDFGYEPGDTPQAVTDNSLAGAIGPDSFANGEVSLLVHRTMGAEACRLLGLGGFYDFGINANRWGGVVPALGVDPVASIDRFGGNASGIGDFTTPPVLPIFWANHTINDNSAANSSLSLARYQATWVNLILLARYLRPATFFEVTFGFHAPADTPSAAVYNAWLAAIADATGSGADKGVIVNDLRAKGAEDASGALGQNAFYPKSTGGAVTASVSGRVMTVDTAPAYAIESGMFLINGSTAFGNRPRVYKQLSGTPGGAGTYQLTYAPSTGDFAATSINLWPEDYTPNPTHPNTAGQINAGTLLAAPVPSAMDAIIAAAGGGSTPSYSALTAEDGSLFTTEAGDRLILE